MSVFCKCLFQEMVMNINVMDVKNNCPIVDKYFILFSVHIICEVWANKNCNVKLTNHNAFPETDIYSISQDGSANSSSFW